MKYTGIFSLNQSNGGTQELNTYTDTVESFCKWIAVISLKMRNSYKLIKIEKI